MKNHYFQLLKTSPALTPSSSYTSTTSYLQHTQQHIHFHLSSQSHLHNLKPINLSTQPLAMSRSLFQARMALPYRGPVSPKPMSQLDIARKGLAASPIDRFDPVHYQAIMQQQAALDPAASIHCPSNMHEVAFGQPDLDLGVQLFLHMPTLAPIAPVQPIAAGQQAAAAAQPANQFHHAGPTAPVFQVLPVQLPGPVQQAAPVPPVAPIHPIVSQVVVVHTVTTQNVPILQAAPAPVHRRAPAQPVATAPAPVRGHRRNRSSGSNGSRHQRKLSYRRNSPPSVPRPSTIQTRRNHTAANTNREPTPEQYNQLSDAYMGSILWQLEEAEGTCNDMEVEESVSPLLALSTCFPS